MLGKKNLKNKNVQQKVDSGISDISCFFSLKIKPPIMTAKQSAWNFANYSFAKLNPRKKL